MVLWQYIAQRMLLRHLPIFLLPLIFGSISGQAQSDDSISIDIFEPEQSGGYRMQITAPRDHDYAIQHSEDLASWQTRASMTNTRGRLTHEIHEATASKSFYRVVQLEDPTTLTGDHIPTETGDLIIHPVEHGTFTMWWNHVSIYVDPVGGAGNFSKMASPDLIFITHPHGDHFNAATLRDIVTDTTTLITPDIVTQQLPSSIKPQAHTMANGDGWEIQDIKITAVPAYNLTAGRLNYHPKGLGNSYVIELGKRRIYFSGDTEDIPEMRALENIDVAFLCMNLPFTMTESQAADGAREFRPRILYPYHYRGSNLETFTDLVGTDLPIEVRLREWY